MKAATNSELPLIVNKYGRMVSSIAFRIIRNRQDAEDAAQEAWLEIVKSLPSFRGESKISTWIYRVAYRAIARHASREKAYTAKEYDGFMDKGEIHDIPCGTDIEKEYWAKESCDRCITGFLHCLDMESRINLVFKDIAGLSYNEMSLILGRDEAALRKENSRSRRKIKNFMERDCYLLNPSGTCRCRLKTMIGKLNLPEEYDKIRASIKKINFFQAADMLFPKVNYWEKFFKNMSQNN